LGFRSACRDRSSAASAAREFTRFERRFNSGHLCLKTLKPAPRDRLRFLPTEEQGEFLIKLYRHAYPRAMSSSEG
jgi:hypothetical protein